MRHFLSEIPTLYRAYTKHFDFRSADAFGSTEDSAIALALEQGKGYLPPLDRSELTLDVYELKGKDHGMEE